MLPVFKGHVLNEEDIITKNAILDVTCRNLISNETLLHIGGNEMSEGTLREMFAEGILNHSSVGYQVTEMGRPFIRNICAALDQRITTRHTSGLQRGIFSKSI
jgi:oxygen-independent coproporphyrinogen-3 oxidase